jgi:hypothetical protein
MHVFLHALLHYTGGANGSGSWYLELSGIVGDIALLPLVAGVWVFLRKHNCHVDGCKSLITSIDPNCHAPACRRHHSLRHLHGKDPHDRA